MRSSNCMNPKFSLSVLRSLLRSIRVISLAALAGMVVPRMQAAPVVYSSPTLVGLTSSSGTNQDGRAQAGRIAANQRGDIFWVNNPYGNLNSLVEVPFGGTTQVLLVANLNAVSFSVTVDPSNNLWVQDGYSDLLFIPFLNSTGNYPSGLDLSQAIPPTCTTLPATSAANGAPCLWPHKLLNAAALNSIVQLSDIQVDANGNIYGVDWCDGIICGQNNRLIEYNGTTGGVTIPVDQSQKLPPEYNSGQLAVTAGGDLYYVDGSNLYHSVAGSFTVSTISGFSSPTGVTIDTKGNLYVTDTGNNRIVLVPNAGGTLNFSGLYSIYNTNATAGAPCGDVGVDGFGNVTFASCGYSGQIYTLAAQQQQVPHSIPILAGFTSSGATIGGGLNQDGQATVGRIAANQRGDIFWVNDPYVDPNNPKSHQSSNLPNSLVEVPFGSSTQVLLVANLGSPSNAVTVDASNNLWVQNGVNSLLFIPFLKTTGSYPTGLDLKQTTPTTCTSLPVTSSSTAPCLWPDTESPHLGNNVYLSDIQLDAGGNIYGVDFFDSSGAPSAPGQSGPPNRLIEYNPTTGVPTVLVDQLSNVGYGGRLAVTPGGDLYYVDGTSLYYSAAGSGTDRPIPGFSNPTGVTIDSKGNLYVTDTGNNRIVLVPSVGGFLDFDGLYSIYNTNAAAGEPCGSVGVDGFGNVTFANNCGSSVVQLYTLFANPYISSFSISPSPATATIGSTIQFTPMVVGVGDKTATWSVALFKGSCSTCSPGTISSTGLYTTPYPFPNAVIVTATSNQNPALITQAYVTLAPPSTAAGPALTVDLGTATRHISPDIYGMNSYPQIYGGTTGYNLFTSGVAKSIALPIDRWNSPTYNYKTDTVNIAYCCHFENTSGGSTNPPYTGLVNTQIMQDKQTATKTMINVPILGWVAQGNTNCSFPESKYPGQVGTIPGQPAYDTNPPYVGCGTGYLSATSKITYNDPNDALLAVDESWVKGWVGFLDGQFGTAAGGGVAIYELDNEPDIWDKTAFNEHPNLMDYNLLTQNGISYAQAIKSADSTAEVSGPVISTWINIFNSKKDTLNGNTSDRQAHNNVPLIDYYLQQFYMASRAANQRLLDYVDLHTYFAPGNLNLNNDIGDTGAQEARLNSTRVMWDPTYLDPQFTDPNNLASTQPYPVQLIPTMHKWIANDYPGTKLAITEYNWGGFNGVTGALAQADLFGIFGREGLDLATLWNPPDPSSAQAPALNAFYAFRNYDGKGSQFGDIALSSISGNQANLAVYGAYRSIDYVVTLVVINKTYGDLLSTLSLANLTVAGTVNAFLYSNANLKAIVPLGSVPVTPPHSGSTTNTITTTFPAQSITVLAVPTNNTAPVVPTN